MDYQSFGRPQRPKGANIKQALKVILVLAVCAWLVYQIKHSTQKYSGQTKLLVGYGAVSLGRKGTPSRLDERALPGSRNVDSAVEATESSSARDGVFDGAREDKAEEEIGHINGKSGTHEGKEVEHEPENQPKVSSKNKYKDSSKEEPGKVFVEARREPDHKEHVTEKYPKRPAVNDSQSNDKELGQLTESPNAVQIRKNAKSDFSAKEKETRTQESVVESATNAGGKEGTDEVLSFHDENGVPPDGNEIKIVFYEENISNFSKGIRFGKSNIYEVTFGGDHDVEVNLEGSKSDAAADEEFNSGTFTHVDTSGINSSSEIGEGDSQVL